MIRQYSQTKCAIYRREWRKLHPEAEERDKQRQREYRLRIMEIVGGKICVKCGYDVDVRALQLDHINSGGCKEYKKQYGRHMYGQYLFYLRNPELAKKTLQVLCANCNFIKRYENGELNHHSRNKRIG